MATGGIDTKHENPQWSPSYIDNLEIQKDEVFACQSFFDGEEEKFNIINYGPDEALTGNNDLFSIQFLVPVRLPQEEITCNICITEESDPSKPAETIIVGTYRLKYVTPLKLTVILPPGYPSSASPIFTLSALWLNVEQLTSLCSQLDELWSECFSMPILNTWIDWLEHNTLSYLNIEDAVDIQVYDNCDGDPRVVSECENLDDAINRLFRYNQQQEALDFIQHNQECQICYIEKSGRDFYRILPCKHYFCKDCVSAYCSIHVKDGTVQELICLEEKCTVELKPFIIKEALSAEEFDRWERLTYQKGLDMMGDITYCPKCQGAVVKEENSLNLAHCMICQFSFCMECSEPLHPGDLCEFKKDPPKEDDNNLEESERERRLRERLRLRAEKDSLQVIRERAKKCPNCTVPIVKIAGCNKVTCSQCLHSFCWICTKDISKVSYGHFRDSPDCNMYNMQGEDIERQTVFVPMEIQLLETQLEEGGEPKFIACPSCNQKNIRKEDKNLIRCWNCYKNLCFLCGKKLSPPYSRHFIKTKCVKYGDVIS